TGFDLDTFLTDHAGTITKVFQGVVAVVACAVTVEGGGEGCALGFALFFAGETAVQQYAEGASASEIVFGAFVNVGVSIATMNVGGAGVNDLATAMIRGAVSGAISGALNTAVYGGDLGENIFKGTAESAVMAGVSWGVATGVRYAMQDDQTGIV